MKRRAREFEADRFAAEICGSPHGLADALVIIPAAQKTDHGSSVSRQYSGSLFEQVLFLATEAIFQSLWDNTNEPAEQLWLRHANLE